MLVREEEGEFGVSARVRRRTKYAGDNSLAIELL